MQWPPTPHPGCRMLTRGCFFANSINSHTLIPFLKVGDLFVIESTSPIGTTEMMTKLIFDERPELEGNIYIAYCPERVLPGNVIYELVHNDRVIGGLNPESTEKAIAFYSQFVQGKLHRTNKSPTFKKGITTRVAAST